MNTPIPEPDPLAAATTHEPEPIEPNRRRRSLIVAFVLVVVAFSVLNGALAWNSVLFGASILLSLFGQGCVWAQCSVGAALLAFAQGPLWARQLIYWLAAICLAGSWAISYALAIVQLDSAWSTDFAYLIVGGTLSFLPLVVVAWQLPFWFCRLVLGWRLADTTAPTAQPDRRLSIADILCTTAVLAAVLGALRAGPTFSDTGGGSDLVGLAMTVAFSSTVALLVGIPLAWIVLRLKNRAHVWFGVLLVWSALFALGLVPVVLSEGILLEVVLLAIGVFGLVGGQALGLGIVRSHGYRLVTGRKRVRCDPLPSGTIASTPPAVAEPPAA